MPTHCPECVAAIIERVVGIRMERQHAIKADDSLVVALLSCQRAAKVMERLYEIRPYYERPFKVRDRLVDTIQRKGGLAPIR